jgi:hypothetical protein
MCFSKPEAGSINKRALICGTKGRAHRNRTPQRRSQAVLPQQVAPSAAQNGWEQCYILAA